MPILPQTGSLGCSQPRPRSGKKHLVAPRCLAVRLPTEDASCRFATQVAEATWATRYDIKCTAEPTAHKLAQCCKHSALCVTPAAFDSTIAAAEQNLLRRPNSCTLPTCLPPQARRLKECMYVHISILPRVKDLFGDFPNKSILMGLYGKFPSNNKFARQTAPHRRDTAMWDETTLDALDAWIGPSWRKARHPIDDDVLHHFVLAVWDETRTLWDERATRDFIRKRMLGIHPNLDDEFLKRFVDNNVDRGTEILNFLTNIKESGRTL